VARMKVPAGYRIVPHWHPTGENVTVLSGTVLMGTGDTVDEKAAHELTAGGFMLVPAETHHYFVARTEAVVQVHGTGAKWGVLPIRPGRPAAHPGMTVHPDRRSR
jgi:quercetin dioxygenase-like cupin family protein